MQIVVILAYLAELAVIWFPPRALREEEPEPTVWWRNVRVWAGVVILAQIAVYAVFG